VANKRKIINDPVHGFISIPDELCFDLIEHPYFQRLRRIKQLGLTHLVYPGALHTRFHHTLGAMHLMVQALSILRSKGVSITPQEEQAAIIAILLHDIGHGPFSHALEHSIVSHTSHEELSGLFMNQLNHRFNGQLETALQIFNNQHPKTFLHQLVSGQLDVDRLDYLRRDSYFTGVSEGMIGTERLLKMLHVEDNQLVVESKGMYSIEHFISARHIMYWQVYLHKTVLAAESLLLQILNRTKTLARAGETLFATPALLRFLQNDYRSSHFQNDPSLLASFAKLDDFDVFSCIKEWADHPDKVLSLLSSFLVNRKLFKIKMQDTDFEPSQLEELKKQACEHFGLQAEEGSYFVYAGVAENVAYDTGVDRIRMRFDAGDVRELPLAGVGLNQQYLAMPVKKHYLCYPRF
jgi:HD superfamily phosphohydrolase